MSFLCFRTELSKSQVQYCAVMFSLHLALCGVAGVFSFLFLKYIYVQINIIYMYVYINSEFNLYLIFCSVHLVLYTLLKKYIYILHTFCVKLSTLPITEIK